MLIAHCRSDEARELTASGSSEDRHDPVVSGHGVEPERERGQPEPAGREPTSAQVANDDAETRHAIQLAEESHRVVVAEVMKELREHADIHTLVRERK